MSLTLDYEKNDLILKVLIIHLQALFQIQLNKR